MRTAPAHVNIARLIDENKIGALQISVILWCALVVFADGYDLMALGYIAPSLTNEWHVARGALGPVFSAALAGLFFGNLGFGLIADRFGRRNTMMIGALFFGLFTLLGTLSHSPEQLLVLRFLAGLGLGGAVPNAVALVSEYLPSQRRALMISLMMVGFSAGSGFAGVIALNLVGHFGWRSVLVVGGIVPIVVALLLPFVLPESIRLLALRHAGNEKIATILAKMYPHERFPADATYELPEQASGFPVAALFANERAPLTLLIWFALFMTQMAILLLTNWLPSVINDAGLAVQQAVFATIMFQIGGTIGGVAFSPLLDRLGPAPIAASFAIAAVAIAALGFAGTSYAAILVLAFIAGFGIIGGQFGNTAYPGMIYPTSIRATGVGWAIGMGRIGAFLGPLIGGTLFAARLPMSTLFLLIASPAVLAGCAYLVMGAIVRRRSSAISLETQARLA